MGIENWDTDTSGENVMMLPLSGFAVLLADDAAIGVKLDYFAEGDRPDAPSGRLQLILTPQQAHDLGRAIRNVAQVAQAKPPAGKLS